MGYLDDFYRLISVLGPEEADAAVRKPARAFNPTPVTPDPIQQPTPMQEQAAEMQNKAAMEQQKMDAAAKQQTALAAFRASIGGTDNGQRMTNPNQSYDMTGGGGSGQSSAYDIPPEQQAAMAGANRVVPLRNPDGGLADKLLTNQVLPTLSDPVQQPNQGALMTPQDNVDWARLIAANADPNSSPQYSTNAPAPPQAAPTPEEAAMAKMTEAVKSGMPMKDVKDFMDTWLKVTTGDKSNKESYKTPLPVTDKGWTISTNNDGLTVARMSGADGKTIEQSYNPNIHGEANLPGKSLDTGAIEMEAEKYLATGQLPATGMSGQGKLQIMNRAAQMAKERGLTGKEAVINASTYRANETALKNDEKQYDLMRKSELQAQAAGQLLKESSANYHRTGIRFVNSLEALARDAATDPKLADMQMKLLAYSREYYKVVTNAYASATELSVGAQAQADKLLNSSDSWASLNAKIDAGQQEMDNTNRTFIETINGRRDLMKADGKRPSSTATPQTPSTSPTSQYPAGTQYKMENGKKLAKLPDGSIVEVK